jgi:hypothetical protein
MPGAPDIDALKALVAHNQYWSDWSTIAVFAALLLEIIIIFAFSKDRPRSETILSLICGLILAIGVYGEYRFGSRAALGNAELQNISDQKVAELNRQANALEQANILKVMLVAHGWTLSDFRTLRESDALEGQGQYSKCAFGCACRSLVWDEP